MMPKSQVRNANLTTFRWKTTAIKVEPFFLLSLPNTNGLDNPVSKNRTYLLAIILSLPVRYINIWNSLPDCVVLSHNLPCFKHKLSSLEFDQHLRGT
uniref:Uncharacterized protein n=1 Tax=Romanomermis culicivorax TaxID=13658 RepID=A0A915J4U5_ROMCU